MTDMTHHAPDYSIAYGSKFQKGRDITEIAKLVRKDIKAAIKEGVLPKGLKVSVRCQRGSGRSLNVQVNTAPYPVKRPATQEEFDMWHVESFPSDEAKRVEDVLESIAKAYNYDGSDTQYDYWNVNFYLHVSTHHLAFEG